MLILVRGERISRIVVTDFVVWGVYICMYNGTVFSTNTDNWLLCVWNFDWIYESIGSNMNSMKALCDLLPMKALTSYEVPIGAPLYSFAGTNWTLGGATGVNSKLKACALLPRRWRRASWKEK